MTMTETSTAAAEHLEEFLRAEQAATELVDQLERLRAETEHYAGARQALDETARGMSSAADNLGTLSSRVGDVIETMRAIGTAELLVGQEHLAKSVSGFEANVGSLDQSVGALNRTVGERLGVTSKQLETLQAEIKVAGQEQARRHQTLDAALGKLPTAQGLAEMRRSLEGSLAEQTGLQHIVSQTLTRLESTNAATAAAMKSLRSLTTTFFLLLLVAVGLVGVVDVVFRPR